MNVIADLLVALATTLAGVAIGWAWEHWRYARRFPLLAKLISGESAIQIVISRATVENFRFEHEAAEVVHTSPPNILFSPLPEARAAAVLAELIRHINRRIDVRIVPPERFDPRVLTVSIGGPSVNSVSAEMLKDSFPGFAIDYPEAVRARYNDLSYSIDRDAATGAVRQDYGFLFSAATDRGKRCIVACGILAFGTEAAIEALIAAKPRSREGRGILSGDKTFAAVRTDVKGLELGQIRLEDVVRRG